MQQALVGRATWRKGGRLIRGVIFDLDGTLVRTEHLKARSYAQALDEVLSAIDLAGCFDVIVSGHEVACNKPAPDIYLRAAQLLGLGPGECISIEDSPVGARAATSAGTWCIAVTTVYTRRGVHEVKLLPEDRIVDDASELPAVVARVFAEHGGAAC
jgi:beta-phosphoglucomutase-like phosphatase (HAD superfamily)